MAKNVYNMVDVYRIINNAFVTLEVDNEDLIVRIPYLEGEPQDIIKTINLEMNGLWDKE